MSKQFRQINVEVVYLVYWCDLTFEFHKKKSDIYENDNEKRAQILYEKLPGARMFCWSMILDEYLERGGLDLDEEEYEHKQSGDILRRALRPYLQAD